MAALGAQMERSRHMPQATKRTGRSLAHVLFLSAALSLLSALVRRERRQLVLTARDRRKKVRVAPQKDRREPRVRDALLRGRRAVRGRGERRRAADRPDEPFGRGRHDHDHYHHDLGLGDQQDPNGPAAGRPAAFCAGRPNSLPPPSRNARSWVRTLGPDRTTFSAREPVPGGTASNTNSPASARRSRRGFMPGSGSRASPRPRTRGRAAARWFPPVSSARRFRLWSRR